MTPIIASLETLSLEEALAYLDSAEGDELSAAFALANARKGAGENTSGGEFKPRPSPLVVAAAKDRDADSQAKFTGAALPAGAQLWSKAGWTSRTRHDAAYVELPNGAKFVLVVFTENHANERGIIPAVARRVIDGMK